MDQTNRLNEFRRLILEVLNMHAQMKGEPAWIQSRVESDLSGDTHRLIDHDPRKNGGTDYVVVELRLFEGKVWVLNDGIEYGIAEDLLEAGIPAEDIVEEFEELPSFAYAEAQAA
ncbi:MAG: hypothetical protein HOP19_28740 [Acidobacteria bacterium]|nr:hypothetical protein [Acidobacteriota bacterium]